MERRPQTMRSVSALCSRAPCRRRRRCSASPAIYADLVRLEEDVDRLLGSNSELGINLRTQKEDLQKMGVPTEICIRHGIVIDQVFAQARANNYDLIVTGSSRARGMLRH